MAGVSRFSVVWRLRYLCCSRIMDLLIGDNLKERAKRLGFYMTSLYGGTTLGQLAIVPLVRKGQFLYRGIGICY